MTNQESFIYNQVLNGCQKELMGMKSSQDAANNAMDDYKKHKFGGKKPLDLIIDSIKQAKKVNKKEIQSNKEK
tara:strand:+ start:10889 stop:11107 length:219 start_codon:yes stop_codon:yes gene_type:complete